ncbi:7TM diverse intracellular signalling [Aquimarina amphilecti]|uniref:7TM diverse intracellular signalling n=1 Tax=Aquimarina amphilecti TaxID=1038014 RepID=A0A1H7K181_AQUAM|nr:histidine kinase [Aquimarina amphilecti]SEK80578.1 7TM diverse intracellular signalling [Aquimarina amphilecti]
MKPQDFNIWLQGVLFVISLYPLLIYFRSKNKIFLFYSLYVICLLFYFSYYGSIVFYDVFFSFRKPIIFYGVQFLAYSFYISFMRELLETKRYIRKWDFVLNATRWVFISFIFLIGVLDVFVSPKDLFVFVAIVLILMTVFAFVSYFVVYKIEASQVKLLIIGSFIYVIMANISLYFSSVSNDLSYDSIIFMEIGAILEILIFALAIGNKIKKISDDKKETQLRFMRSSLEAAELKTIALKAQMNPHFIFNVLNSINNYILKNDIEKASDYLTKFSKLIRRVLKNSTERTISLSQEVEIVKNYIELERLRMKNNFSFYFEKTADLANTQIPPLCLQPFIENAIWHGLHHKKGEKLLKIKICQPDKHTVKIVIVDNGIGRKKASELKNTMKNSSFGSKVTKERILAMHPKNSLFIENFEKENVIEPGTKVTIHLRK